MFKKIIMLPFKIIKKIIDIVLWPFKSVLRHFKERKHNIYAKELNAIESAILMAKKHKLDIFIESDITEYTSITVKTKEIKEKKLKKNA